MNASTPEHGETHERYKIRTASVGALVEWAKDGCGGGRPHPNLALRAMASIDELAARAVEPVRVEEPAGETEQNAHTRYTLAVLDNTILDLAMEAKGLRDMAQEVATRAERLETFKARLMDARDGLRPILDSSAPKEYPYDKR